MNRGRKSVPTLGVVVDRRVAPFLPILYRVNLWITNALPGPSSWHLDKDWQCVRVA